MRVFVVVLGDFGRSPRMMYHTLSFSQQHQTSVEVIAMGGSAPLPQLAAAPNVNLSSLQPPPAWLSHFPRFLFLMLKVNMCICALQLA